MKNNSFIFYILLILLNVALPTEGRSPTKEFVSISENIFIEMNKIPCGSFETPKYASWNNHYDENMPWYPKKINKPYYIGTYEITQSQWFEIMKSWPIEKNYTSLSQNSIFYDYSQKHKRTITLDLLGIGDEYPVFGINFFEAAIFCNKLSERVGLVPCYYWENDKIFWNRNANGFRLPTTAEWKFAACGGKTCRNKYYWGNKLNNKYANILDNEKWPNPTLFLTVGSKLPNKLGLYDIVGNTIEWCWDYENGKAPQNIQINNSKNNVNLEYDIRGVCGGQEEGIHFQAYEGFIYERYWQYGLRIARNAD